MQDILDTIVNSRILNLLEIININYPDKFNKNNIEKELNYIKEHIHWKKKDNSQTSLESKNKIKLKTRTKLNNKANNKVNKVNNKKLKFKKKTKKKEIDKVIQTENNIQQCSGRVWSEHIFNRKNMKKLNDIEDKFKVEDFNDLDIKEFNSKYVIGLRCSRNKIEMIDDSNKNNTYCKLHSKHLIHGDYLVTPDKELCHHFIKDGKYL